MDRHLYLNRQIVRKNPELLTIATVCSWFNWAFRRRRGAQKITFKSSSGIVELRYGMAIPNAFSVGVSILPLLLIPESTWKAINEPRVLLPRTPSIGPE